MRVLAMAGLTLCWATVPALAQDDGDPSKPLSGSYYMGPAIDAEDPNAPADHLYLTLTGDAAKSMWDAMKVETTPDECVGRMARWVQSMVCYGPASPQSGFYLFTRRAFLPCLDQTIQRLLIGFSIKLVLPVIRCKIRVT